MPLHKWRGMYWQKRIKTLFVYSGILLCVCQSLSRVRLFETPWIVARQASLLMEFSRPENWRGLPFSSPGDLLHPGIKPASPVSSGSAGRFFTTEPLGKPLLNSRTKLILIAPLSLNFRQYTGWNIFACVCVCMYSLTYTTIL